MAITNGYATRSQVKAELGIEDFDDDFVLDDTITAASRAIDDWCGRRFYDDGSDSTRYFTARNPNRILLTGSPQSVDLQSVTSVTVDTTGNGTYGTTWTENTHFRLGPASAAADSEPYRWLQILRGASTIVPVGIPDSIKIVGTFGWAAVPPPVERACIALTESLFKQLREAPFGGAQFDLEGSVMRMSRYLPGNVEMLLRPYRVVGNVAGHL